MSATDPFPLLDGQFVIDRSRLPAPMRQVLEKAESLHALAQETRREADPWEQEGRTPRLVAARRRLASIYEEFRDEQLRSLWTSQGAQPPEGLDFRKLLIRK